MNKRAKLRLLLVFIFIGFIIAPAFADEQTIELSPEVPYVDITVEAIAPTQITIETINGTPQTNLSFIDSWVELWQGATKLFANDDGAHSATNFLASYISASIEAGTYFIRATSYALMCCNQTPTGSYFLTWNGVTTIEPIPSPTPTPEITESIFPTPEPSITNSIITTPTPEPTIEPTPEENTSNQNNEIILIPEILTPSPQIILPEIQETELEIVEQIIEEETIEIPIVEEEITLEEIQEQIDKQYIQENTIELSVPTALENIPGAEQIFAATEAILNVGSDMTQEQREESQAVVVATIVVSQIASMASVTASAQNKRFRK